MSFKKCSVVMLPTNEKAMNGQIYIPTDDGTLNTAYPLEIRVSDSNDQIINKAQHLYITSDEEIKVDDWYLYKNLILQAPINSSEMVLDSVISKIIASTDISLKLPQSSRQFIEKYIEEYNKGNVITKVMVEYVQVPNSVFIQVLEAPYIQLKINSDNTINIKPIKNSWNREEHIANIKAFAKEFVANTNTAYKQKDINDWFNYYKENLM